MDSYTILVPVEVTLKARSLPQALRLARAAVVRAMASGYQTSTVTNLRTYSAQGSFDHDEDAQTILPPKGEIFECVLPPIGTEARPTMAERFPNATIPQTKPTFMDLAQKTKGHPVGCPCDDCDLLTGMLPRYTELRRPHWTDKPAIDKSGGL